MCNIDGSETQAPTALYGVGMSRRGEPLLGLNPGHTLRLPLWLFVERSPRFTLPHRPGLSDTPWISRSMVHRQIPLPSPSEAPRRSSW
jgi:hypothetical protein